MNTGFSLVTRFIDFQFGTVLRKREREKGMGGIKTGVKGGREKGGWKERDREIGLTHLF